MNHKRKKPKHQRSGCLMCKYHKHEAIKRQDRTRAKRAWQKAEEKAN